MVRNVGATVNFVGTGLGTSANEITFTNAPTSQLQGNNGGILPFATINSNDFATYGNVPGSPASSIQTFAGYNTNPDPSTWGPLDTIKLTGLDANSTPAVSTLSGNKIVNAINLAGSNNSGQLSLGEAGHILTITSGALLQGSNSLGATIAGGTLDFGNGGLGEAIVMGYSTSLGAGLLVNFYNEPNNIDLGSSPTDNVTVPTADALYNATQDAASHTPTIAFPPNATRVDPNLNYPASQSGLTAGVIGGGDVGLPFGVQQFNLGAQWTGYLNILTSGLYVFTLSAFDGGLLFIDGKFLGSAFVTTTTVTVPLNSGVHTFESIFQKQPINNVTNPYINAFGFPFSTQTGITLAYSGPDTNGANPPVPACAQPQHQRVPHRGPGDNQH